MFEAKYGGKCGGCGDRIAPGGSVKYVEGELVHVPCEDAVMMPVRKRVPAVVCTSCWLEKPCECDERGAA